MSAPVISEPAAKCPNCGAALASDQRYCLTCGQRLSSPRVDFHQALGLEAPAPPPPPRKAAWTDRGAVLTLVAIAAIVVALGVGIVIGRGKGGSDTAGKPTVVTVAGGGSGAPTNTAATGTGTETAAVKADWPSGKSGWTVEVSSLPKSGTTLADVNAAKSAASAKGAKDVGMLDGDQHSGTPTGKYVIYSGDFSSKKDAQAAQGKLKKQFPGALVLHVQRQGSAGGGNSATNANAPASGSQGLSQVQAEQHLTGRAYEKASAKLPSEVGTGGKPPPVDHKKAGGGTSATCIGC